jgi:predicted transcriptional regulator
MSTVQEIKEAAARLSPLERLRLSKWLTDSEDVQRLRRDELKKELMVGIKEADRGELLDSEMVFARLDEKIRKRPSRGKGG